MPRAQEFIQLFNELDGWLRRQPGNERSRGFMERVETCARRNPSLRRNRDDLREFAELRNAIVHHRGFPSEFIADPTEDAVAALARVCERVMRPQRVIPRFQREVRVFHHGDGLYDALRYMGEQGFSQVPVLDGPASPSKLDVLSAEGIARWVCAKAADGSVDIQAAKLADVLPFEKHETFALLPHDASVDEARDLFERAMLSKRPKLRCVIITPDGRPGPRIMALITPSDLLEE